MKKVIQIFVFHNCGFFDENAVIIEVFCLNAGILRLYRRYVALDKKSQKRSQKRTKKRTQKGKSLKKGVKKGKKYLKKENVTQKVFKKEESLKTELKNVILLKKVGSSVLGAEFP